MMHGIERPECNAIHTDLKLSPNIISTCYGFLFPYSALFFLSLFFFLFFSSTTLAQQILSISLYNFFFSWATILCSKCSRSSNNWTGHESELCGHSECGWTIENDAKLKLKWEKQAEIDKKKRRELFSVEIRENNNKKMPFFIVFDVILTIERHYKTKHRTEQWISAVKTTPASLQRLFTRFQYHKFDALNGPYCSALHLVCSYLPS